MLMILKKSKSLLGAFLMVAAVLSAVPACDTGTGEGEGEGE